MSKKKPNKPKRKRKVVVHLVRYVHAGGHSDQYACACGWKSEAYWDYPEAAWREWLVHAHDVCALIEPRDKASQERAVAARNDRLQFLQNQRVDINRRIRAETSSRKRRA